MPNKNEIIDKQLVIQEVIAKLKYFTKLYGIKSIFVVGGYCREHYFGKIWRVKDIDVASAYQEQARQLGGLFASEILNSAPEFYERTGTAAVEYPSEFGSIRVEFQGDSINTYMHNQEVKTWMQSQGIDDVPLMNNIYGRDFTINSLIYSLHNETMYDPTNQAIRDLDRHRISSLLPAHMLIKYNPLAALRAIRFSVQYDFHIDSDLRLAIKDSGSDNLCNTLSRERVVKEVVKVLKTNGPEALDMLKRFNLDRILLHPDVKKYVYLGSEKKKDAKT
jgi:tRNA nucleotidyltransferase/poly(A) polymerase